LGCELIDQYRRGLVGIGHGSSLTRMTQFRPTGRPCHGEEVRLIQNLVWQSSRRLTVACASQWPHSGSPPRSGRAAVTAKARNEVAWLRWIGAIELPCVDTVPLQWRGPDSRLGG